MALDFFFFSSRRRHTRYIGDWSSDVCSSDLDHYHLSLRIGDAWWVAPDVARLDQWKHEEAQLYVEELGTRAGPAGEAPRIVEIGRASCRERVWIVVGARWVRKTEGTAQRNRD